MTSKPKRKAKESGSGSYNSKMKKIDEALGVSFFEIAHDYKPYSILNRFVQDRKTKEWVELNPRQLELDNVKALKKISHSIVVESLRDLENALTKRLKDLGLTWKKSSF